MLTRTESKDQAPTAQPPRRGVTAMEYLLLLSLIIVACLVGVGYVGSNNNKGMTGSANAIGNSIKKGS